RTYPAAGAVVPLADVWLIQRAGGGAEHCLMHGQISPPRAEELAALLAGLGGKVGREDRPYEGEGGAPGKKRLTPAEQLAHPCPACGVGPGEKCRNYLGKGKASCPDRGRPAEKPVLPESKQQTLW